MNGLILSILVLFLELYVILLQSVKFPLCKHLNPRNPAEV